MERQNKRKKRRKMLLIIFAIGLFLVPYFIWENNALTVSRYRHTSENFPEGISELTILHISDLHNKAFGKGQERLIDIARETRPDLVCITGDLIDRRRKGMEHALDFVRGAVDIAPVYYVTGNHEEKSKEYVQLKRELEGMGVVILDNESIVYQKGEAAITLWGLSDPARYEEERFRKKEYYEKFRSRQDLMKMTEREKLEEGYHILLAHRPQYFSIYQDYSMDLVLSGHMHGGQVRLPGVGAVFSPDFGLFPPYTEGMVTEGGSTIVISRGLGNSVIPIRIFNRPEVVVITLSRE